MRNFEKFSKINFIVANKCKKAIEQNESNITADYWM